MIDADSPLAVAATTAVHTGDTARLRELLQQHPELSTERIGDHHLSRTLLHALTDWPGHYPDERATAAVLLAAGADVNARFAGPHDETPLHWAASSDDVEMIDVLLDAGADIDAPGAVLGGGSALADAVGFGCWAAARRLVERGASIELWQAAALGPRSLVDELIADAHPDHDTLTRALWSAAHGGQHEIAEHLVTLGADPNWVGYDDLTAAGAAERQGHAQLAVLLRGLAHG
jgi:ankyrin repeat protein